MRKSADLDDDTTAHSADNDGGSAAAIASAKAVAKGEAAKVKRSSDTKSRESKSPVEPRRESKGVLAGLFGGPARSSGGGKHRRPTIEVRVSIPRMSFDPFPPFTHPLPRHFFVR
jgi:hypothetical protein